MYDLDRSCLEYLCISSFGRVRRENKLLYCLFSHEFQQKKQRVSENNSKGFDLLTVVMLLGRV